MTKVEATEAYKLHIELRAFSRIEIVAWLASVEGYEPEATMEALLRVAPDIFVLDVRGWEDSGCLSHYVFTHTI